MIYRSDGRQLGLGILLGLGRLLLGRIGERYLVRQPFPVAPVLDCLDGLDTDAEFGVCVQTIEAIKYRRNWKWLTDQISLSDSPKEKSSKTEQDSES